MHLLGIKKEGRKGDESDFLTCHINDIFYITLEMPLHSSKHSDPILVFHSKYGEFYQLVTLRDLYTTLSPFGFDFLDKSILVTYDQADLVLTISLDSDEKLIKKANDIKKKEHIIGRIMTGIVNV